MIFRSLLTFQEPLNSLIKWTDIIWVFTAELHLFLQCQAIEITHIIHQCSQKLFITVTSGTNDNIYDQLPHFPP